MSPSKKSSSFFSFYCKLAKSLDIIRRLGFHTISFNLKSRNASDQQCLDIAEPEQDQHQSVAGSRQLPLHIFELFLSSQRLLASDYGPTLLRSVRAEQEQYFLLDYQSRTLYWQVYKARPFRINIREKKSEDLGFMYFYSKINSLREGNIEHIVKQVLQMDWKATQRWRQKKTCGLHIHLGTKCVCRIKQKLCFYL